jgi:protein-disulfide isomerase
MKTYSAQVKVIYKDYPLIEIHPWAMHAAVGANCLAAQNNEAYWEFADYAHANQKVINGEKRDIKEENARLDQITLDLGKRYNINADQLQACVKKQDESSVRASMSEGDKLGVDATPTMFINGERISGVQPDSVLRDVIDRALKDASQTPLPAPSAEPAPKPSAQ